MKLHIKKNLLILLLFSVAFTFGQSEKNNEFPEYNKYSILKVGYDFSFPFGNNFAEASLKKGRALNFEYSFNLFKSDFLLGFGLGLAGFEVTNQEVVGNYDSSTIFFIGPKLSYQFFPRKKLRLRIIAKVEYVEYKNTIKTNDFKDKGIRVGLSPEISYNFSKVFGLYFSPNVHKDFLQIETPPEIQDFFNSANYFNLTFGIRLVL